MLLLQNMCFVSICCLLLLQEMYFVSITSSGINERNEMNITVEYKAPTDHSTSWWTWWRDRPHVKESKYGPRHSKNVLGHIEQRRFIWQLSVCASAQSAQGFDCPLTGLLDTIECISGQQMPG